MSTRAYAAIAILALGWLAGILCGWGLWHPRPTPPTTYAPQVVQTDSSVILERKPQPNATPSHEIPARSRVERIVQVVIRPDTLIRRDTVFCDTQQWGICPPCPPVTTDLSIIRLRDGSRRAIASSPDGRVIAGVDVPVDPGAAMRVLRWSAGARFDSDLQAGAYLARDLGPFVLGASVTRSVRPELSDWRCGIQAGIRF